MERLALVTPGPAATRWLLLGDLVCLLLVGRAARWPALGVAVAVGVGFVGLNLVSMAVRDFYLGLALFHLAVGVAAATLGPTRWAGLALGTVFPRGGRSGPSGHILFSKPVPVTVR